ncbi:hypothetical protein ACFQRB_09065 [Halobaculum litoreum]|uniref:Uncharacterized protein n=1 Tax=Halobaculum litoreum TaxID=3031998 RepID=A0ABD5XN66_9EURY
MSRYLRATLSAPGVRAGAAGGLVTAASALVGYVLVPTLDAGGALRDGWWLGFETLLAGDPAYAAGVLFVPAAVTTCLGVGAARRRGASRRRAALAVGGGTVAVAALAALATFLSGVLFVAVTVALAAGTTVEGCWRSSRWPCSASRSSASSVSSPPSSSPRWWPPAARAAACWRSASNGRVASRGAPDATYSSSVTASSALRRSASDRP